MKRATLFLCLVFGVSSVATASEEDFYPDFALVVHVPSYEAFLTNLGDSPIRVDGYAITSTSGSLSPVGWAPMDSAGPDIVAASAPGRMGSSLPVPLQTLWPN